VVDVILVRHLGTSRTKHSRDRVAERRPPRVPHVQRTRRVRAHKLHVDALPRKRLSAPVCGPLLHHAASGLTRARRIERDIDETGAGDLGFRNSVELFDAGHNLCRKLARICANALRKLHRDVRGPVSVFAILRSLNLRIRFGYGNLRGVSTACSKEVSEDTGNCEGEFLWRHKRQVYRSRSAKYSSTYSRTRARSAAASSAFCGTPRVCALTACSAATDVRSAATRAFR